MKSDKHIDSNLVEAYQSGDQKALVTLVKRWHMVFCEKAYWIVKDSDVSKDIAQECWQTIIDKINKLNDPSSFGSWAIRIVYNKSFDALRKKNKEFRKLNELQYEQSNYEEVYDERTNLKRQLFSAIQNLSEDHQMVIRLFYLEEYSLKEISKALEISIGTTKSRLFHAREKLKQVLKNKIENY